jgi:damage-control phosphatase, subfamily I
VEEKGRRFVFAGPGIVKTDLQCLPCFHGQISRTLRHAGVKGDRGRSIARKADLIIEEASLQEVPARTTTRIHRLLRQETSSDPYRSLKETYNQVALELLPAVRDRIAQGDRFEGSVRAAIAGNVIDFGIYESIDLHRSIEESFQLPLSGDDYRALVHAVQTASSVLYLCDNAGEIVFDRLLIEALVDQGKRVTAAVKGMPVINDATLDDAFSTGLAGFCTVIDNGNDGIGTLLEACSSPFLDAYRSADLIISKGQANFETLMQTEDNRIFFLFKVKCPVVARVVGCENGDIVIMNNRAGACP